MTTSAAPKSTPHTCLGCRRTFFTFTANGYSQAFQEHVESCPSSKYNFMEEEWELF